MKHDLKIIDYGPRCITIVKTEMHESDTYKLDKFYEEEMVTVFVSDQVDSVKIMDKNSKMPALHIETDFLRLSPNFFFGQYALFVNDLYITDLDQKLWVDMMGTGHRLGNIC